MTGWRRSAWDGPSIKMVLALGVFAVLFLAITLLFGFGRPPLGLLWWAFTILSASALLTWIVAGAFGSSERMNRAKAVVWALTGLVGGLLALLQPAVLLSVWIEDEGAAYPVAQVVGALVCVATGAWLLRRFTSLTQPSVEAGATTLLAEAARIPAGGKGKAGARRRRRREELDPRGTFVQRMSSGVLQCASLLARDAALAAVTLLAWGLTAAFTAGAFVEGWLALLLTWVLLFETRLVRARRESLVRIAETEDPFADRTRHDVWFGLTAGLALAMTASMAARMAGLRPQPWWWFLTLLVLGVLAAVLPIRLLTPRADALLDGWLRRRPERGRQLRELADAYSGSPRSFGKLPDAAAEPEPGYDGGATGERPRGR